ncbi:MAG: sarcosine oxidase subunit gamma [Brevirhabdus sp.]
MSELATSALSGAQFNGLALIEDAGLCGMISLRGDLAAAAVKKAVKAATGLQLPNTLEYVAGEANAIAWFSPDELLILTPYDEAEAMTASLSGLLAGKHHLVLNVSDARALIRVSGRALADVLAKLTPMDVSASAFGPGTCRRTRLAQIPVAMWMPAAGRVELVCFRSVSGYAFEALKTCAYPGSDVKHHTL